MNFALIEMLIHLNTRSWKSNNTETIKNKTTKAGIWKETVDYEKQERQVRGEICQAQISFQYLPII